jgi:hypothetical protein
MRNSRTTPLRRTGRNPCHDGKTARGQCFDRWPHGSGTYARREGCPTPAALGGSRSVSVRPSGRSPNAGPGTAIVGTDARKFGCEARPVSRPSGEYAERANATMSISTAGDVIQVARQANGVRRRRLNPETRERCAYSRARTARQGRAEVSACGIGCDLRKAEISRGHPRFAVQLEPRRVIAWPQRHAPWASHCPTCCGKPLEVSRLAEHLHKELSGDRVSRDAHSPRFS